MFEQRLIEHTLGQTKTKYTVVVSFLVQCLAISIMILVPLIYTNVLPATQFMSFLVAPPPPPPKVEAPKAAPQRIRVGGNVQRANQIFAPPPVYPPLAKQARIQGVVRLNAIINKEGLIEQLAAVSGHPLLIPSALEAVKK